MSTISIALSSLIRRVGRWIYIRPLVLKMYVKSIYWCYGFGLIMTFLVVYRIWSFYFRTGDGAMLFGIGFGMFDANNMPILCQFVSARYRATAYGIMNMCGVFAGATITSLLGESMDAGHLGRDFALLAILVFVMLVILVTCLRPKTIDMKDFKNKVVIVTGASSGIGEAMARESRRTAPAWCWARAACRNYSLSRATSAPGAGRPPIAAST